MKVFAVHLNYRSRAEQRGRIPTEPSYFLKPESSVSEGGPVLRPRGTELLAFEGEIAVVLADRVRGVSPEAGLAAIGAYAPANDWGLHDLRWADRGSNLLSKGQDGFTPIGPPLPADSVEPSSLTLRTRQNGVLVQEASTAELLFGFGQLVADLSRFMTLEPGDVILTGTPAGAGLAQPGDVVEVSLDGRSSVISTVVESDQPLAPYGAMPRATADARAHVGLPAAEAPSVPAALRTVSTATLTAQLARHGLHRTFLAGLRPSRPELRMAGVARTLRYGAMREDIRDRIRGSGPDAQKRLVELTGPGEVLVMEARGCEGAGTIGDILVERVRSRGAAGVVTDGGVRDTPGVAGIELPCYYRVPNAASLWTEHVPLEIDVPVTCAGVLVMPGDVVVGDAEGVVVVPAALAGEVARDAAEQELRESWAMERVRAGEPIHGLYPLADERREEFERWRQERGR